MERRYFMSELFPKDFHETLAWNILWLSLTNVILACITFIIFITQTPATMKSFRNLLSASLSIQMMYEIFNGFYKPAILLPLPIYIPVIPISSVTDALNSFGPYISVIYETFTLDLLLCMLIQRYFTMSKNVISHPKHLENSVYGMVFFTNFIMVSMLIISNFIGDRLSEQDTIIFIQKHIIDWENLLSIVKNPSIIFLRENVVAIFEKYYTIAYGISRLFIFIFFTRLNMKIIFGTSETPQTRKQHQMIIRLLKFQFLAVLFLIIFPLNLMIFAISFQIPHPMIPMYCILLLKLYPPVDMLFTTFLIKPYREFVKKVIFKIFQLKSARIADNGSAPKIHIPNQI